jgi:phosphate ABC transporter phosphate-binding protein
MSLFPTFYRSPRLRHRLLAASLATGLVAVIAAVGTIASPGSAVAAQAYVPIVGEGSSWSANAIDQWVEDVHQYGMRVSYTANGSSAGRQAFLNGTTDFAGSDIPFQTQSIDGAPAENPQANSFAYIPVTAGGTTFMYNLSINGQRVTNLRLSGENITKIFTGVITKWNDPALQADNPGLALPNLPIVPVVRSDGSGSTAQLVTWMINQYPSIWEPYCTRLGAQPCNQATSYYPASGSMVAQSGDLGVAGYVAQGYSDGAIGYVEYSYALNAGFPVAKMLNDAGYYTEPTPNNVAVSLLKAQVDTTDVNNPGLYLTQKLGGVYTDPDPRTYPLSSYSYMVVPTATTGQDSSFTTAKGNTLGAFIDYAMCQGQDTMGALGYSPMPINLVEASFNQVPKIPGASGQHLPISQCDNPTFSSNGTNLLADDAPDPAACDKKGPTQCTTGTGGAAKEATAPSGGGQTSTTVAASGSTQSGAGNSGSTTATTLSNSGQGSTNSGTGSGSTPKSGPSSKTAAAPPASQCNADTGSCGSVAAVGNAVFDAAANPTVLPAKSGWTSTQTLMVLAGLMVLILVLGPGLVWRHLGRGTRP